jgi:hypothetical protein
MAFHPAPVHFDYSERASRLRTAYPQRVSRGRRERQAQGDAGHVCAEAIEKVMPPRKTGARKQLRELLESYATFLQAASCSGFPSERCSAHARLI